MNRNIRGILEQEYGHRTREGNDNGWQGMRKRNGIWDREQETMKGNEDKKWR